MRINKTSSGQVSTPPTPGISVCIFSINNHLNMDEHSVNLGNSFGQMRERERFAAIESHNPNRCDSLGQLRKRQ